MDQHEIHATARRRVGTIMFYISLVAAGVGLIWIALGNTRSVFAAVLGALSLGAVVFVAAELTGRWPVRAPRR